MKISKLVNTIYIYLSSNYRFHPFEKYIFGLIAVYMSFYPNYAQSFPSKIISISDWGLSHPSQIGHFSLGILHKKDGDEIVVYDIRKHKPTLKSPEGPRGRIPSLKGDYFLVSHFNQGNINRLEGYFNGFAKYPSKSYVSIDKISDDISVLTYYFKNRSPGFSGMWIHLFNFKAPPAEQFFLDTTPFTYLTFSFRGDKGDEKIMLRIADRVMEKNEDSLLIGEVSSFLPQGKVKQQWQTAWIPLSRLGTRINRRELASVVFQVEGNDSGRVFLKNLAFAKKWGGTIPNAKNDSIQSCSSNRALWLWETERILHNPEEQNKLLRFSKNHHITDLFLQIPYQAKNGEKGWTIFWDSAAMRPLLSKLNQAGIRVHALDGDPHFTLKELHGRSIGLLEKIIRYNQTASPEERFYGIRYDNEPYLLPNFGGVYKESLLKEYLELVEKSQALAQKAGLIFGVDIPFWLDGFNEHFEPTATVEGRPMSERIIDVVDNIGIMDYRTIAYGADGVIEHAVNELKYAAKKNKKVFIGLETVSLPDETIYDFGLKGKGSRLLIKTINSQKIEITFIPKEEIFDTRETFILHQTRQAQVPSDKLTFNKKTAKDLNKVMRHSESEFCQFSSFNGFAIHSYESYRPWLENQNLPNRAEK